MATLFNAAAWAALEPTVTVTGVTIASPPVVTFSVTDSVGNPVIGLENLKSLAAGNTLATYPNVSFALAKLEPRTDAKPSSWVSYIVTSVSNANGAITGAQRPGTDNNGTLEAVAGSPGTYKYTFRRDIPGTKAAVDALRAKLIASAEADGDGAYLVANAPARARQLAKSECVLKGEMWGGRQKKWDTFCDSNFAAEARAPAKEALPAALDELVDFGRPRRVWLAVLVDRGGRELPIAAAYAAARISLPAERKLAQELGERLKL